MSNNQPEKIEFKVSPESIGKMTSQEVRAAISANYPDYKEDVCRAYMTGAMTSAMNLGMPEEAIGRYISEWCMYDEQMYVASMFAAAHTKEMEFTASLMSPSGSPGLYRVQ